MGRLRAGFMEPRREVLLRNQRRASIFLVSIMLLAIIPVIATPVIADDSGRDANITLMVTPTAQTVNPGETAEYTVRVTNNGANPVSINLAAANEQDCNGYSSTIGQIGQPIDSGATEDTFLNVTLAQNAEDSCITTVTANANEQVTPPDQPGAPAQETYDVTTTAGDGAGSEVFGVELIVDQPSRTWAGESTIEWDVEVTNTGRVQETIDLTLEDITSGPCVSSSGFSVSVDPAQVQLDNESSEWVLVTLDVPAGASAEKYCWEITGVVSNDQNPNGSASDVEPFDLTVPELKECDLELSKSSVSIDPGDSGSLEATFSNTGNADWSVNVAFTGSKASWASVDGASSGMLPYDDGNGEKEFTIDITPDDSVEANSQSTITIQGRDGNLAKCSSDINVVVGQSHGASMSLGNSVIHNIDPGANAVTTLTVTNEGNGPDTFRISASSPPSGWAVSLESSTISTNSRHSNQKQGTIEIQVSLPGDALATEEVEITFSVMPNSGGAAYATQTLRITVKAIHGMSGDSVADDQTGRSDTTVRFPITVYNDGNTADSFRFSVISQTATPAWGNHFETVDDEVKTEINIDARSSAIMYLVVSIDGEEELASTRLTVRVTNIGDNNNGDTDDDGIPDNQIEFTFRAILSDRNFAMDCLIMHSTNDLSRNGALILPPGGTSSYQIKVINTGDGHDDALFDFSGLQGTATRTIYHQGMELDGAIHVPKGWGARDLATGEFYYENGGPMIGSTDDKIVEKMIAAGLMETHEAIEYYAVIELVITASSSSENGDGGLLEMVVTSVANAANRSGKITISLSVETVMSLEMELTGDAERDITFGDIESNSKFYINITNSGNVETEVKVFASEGLRGWSVTLSADQGCESDGADLICILDEGESMRVTALVRPPSIDNAEITDEYIFTLSVEPTDVGLVGRENIELTVTGHPETFALNSLITPNVLYGMVGVIILGLFFLSRRKRP